MNRREILRYTALITGTAISPPLASTILSGCSEGPNNQGNEPSIFFSNDEMDLVRELIDTMLPKTETPSASELDVHLVIDSIVGSVYDEKARAAYREAFKALRDHLTQGDFSELNADQKLESLKKLESLAENDPVRKAYLDLKQQAVAFYLSTEEIAENYLNYLPVPGEYQSCISLEEAGGKMWAI